MATVHIVIEWHGNGQEVDGATVHGVYGDRESAEAVAGKLAPQRIENVEIIERTLGEEVTHGDDGH